MLALLFALVKIIFIKHGGNYGTNIQYWKPLI